MEFNVDENGTISVGARLNESQSQRQLEPGDWVEAPPSMQDMHPDNAPSLGTVFEPYHLDIVLIAILKIIERGAPWGTILELGRRSDWKASTSSHRAFGYSGPINLYSEIKVVTNELNATVGSERFTLLSPECYRIDYNIWMETNSAAEIMTLNEGIFQGFNAGTKDQFLELHKNFDLGANGRRAKSSKKKLNNK